MKRFGEGLLKGAGVQGVVELPLEEHVRFGEHFLVTSEAFVCSIIATSCRGILNKFEETLPTLSERRQRTSGGLH